MTPFADSNALQAPAGADTGAGAGAAPGVLSPRPLTKQQILSPESLYNIALKTLIQNNIRAEIDRESTEVYAKIRRNNLYFRGKQFLTMIRSPDSSVVDYRPVSSGGMTPFTVDQSNARDPMYDNILPLFRGDVRKWCGVLGVRAPNAKCMPRTVGDDHQIRLSRIGDRAISYLLNSWQSDELQRYLSYSLAVNGTTFGFVQYVADENKYGSTEIPRLSVVQVPVGDPYFSCWKCGTDTPAPAIEQNPSHACPTCGAPLDAADYREPDTAPGVQVTSIDRYPNGAVELQMATAATVKTPFYSISDTTKLPWLWYEYLANRYELIRSYAPPPRPGDNSPDAAFRRQLRDHLLSDTISDSFGVSTQEVRRTANVLSSPTGIPYERKSLTSFGQYFLSPGMYEAITDDRSGNIREQISANFKKGLWLIYIGGKLADVRHAAICEHWSICQPDVGEFIYRDAVFDDYIQGTDVVNDCLNLNIQQAEKSLPLTFFDPDVVDPAALRDRQVQVGEFLEAKKGVGGQLAQSFFRTPVATFDNTLQQFMDFYIQKNRENVGIMPALYGGGEADEAVGVAKIRRNQSLMQLNIPWNNMRTFWAETYSNGMRLLAQYSNGKLVLTKGGSVEIEELDGVWELAQGGWVVQCEEAMPMSWAQRQERTDELMQNTHAWPLIGLVSPPPGIQVVPDNLEHLQEDIGLPDWVVPGLAAKERLLDIVEQLLRADPVDQPPPGPPPPMPPAGPPMPPPGPPAGAPIGAPSAPPPPGGLPMPAGPPMPPPPPPPPSPSIQPNQTMFDAPFAVSVLRGWLVSDKGAEAERGVIPGQAPRGFENVLAYTKAWMDLAMAPPPPPPPPPPEQPKVSLSVKAPDLLMPGVPQAVQAFESGQVPPPPPPGLPPMGSMGPPPGGPPGGPPGRPPGPPPGGPGPAAGPPPPDQRQLASSPPANALKGPPPAGGFMASPPVGGLQ